jgi:hypothetical protein
MKKFNILAEKILNGIAKGKSLEDISKKYNVSVDELKKQLDFGISVEKEHTQDENYAKSIAMDHLWELGPTYYKELNKLENKLN